MSNESNIAAWIIPGATASVLLITVILDLIKITRSRKTVGVKTLHDLRKEYEEEDMKLAVVNLHRLYRIASQKEKDVFVETYNHIVESQREKHHGQSDLDNNRKLFSHFYQKLSTYYCENIIYDKILFPSWSRPDLKILGEVVLPIEKSFPQPSKTALDNLKKLYDDFSKWKKKV